MRIIKGRKGLTALDYVIDDEFAQKAIAEKKPAKPVTTKRAKRRNIFMKRSYSIPRKLQSVKKRRRMLEKQFRIKQRAITRKFWKETAFSFAMAAKKLREKKLFIKQIAEKRLQRRKKSLGVIIRKRRLTIRRAAVKRLIKSKKITTTPKRHTSDKKRIEMLEKEIVLLKDSLDAVWKLGYENGYEDGKEEKE